MKDSFQCSVSKKRSILSELYHPSLALLTDFYQLSMAYGYWKSGLDKKDAVFHLFYRRQPFGGGFSVAAGLESVISYLENFCFDPSDLAYLATLKNAKGTPYFTDDFFEYLSQLKFTCDVDAVPEGTTVFPYEPLLRIHGPLIQCQILESPLLNLMNFQTLIATKAARICMAAEGDSVMEFGLRRAQGIDGSLSASRACYIGGCDATSNLLAGKLFGIPVKGTHSHSWVMVFENELESFETYAQSMPNNCVFLVDTYNTMEGVKKAIEVGKWLRAHEKPFLGVRLDSGDLAYLSIKTRKLLDEAGFQDADIVATNELDEILITELKRQGAKISVWGVGTNLVTARDTPALDGVYKLSAIRDVGEKWQYTLKLSEQLQKVSNPGVLQVRRFRQNGENSADLIYNIEDPISDPCRLVDPFDSTKHKLIKETEYQDLLVPIFRNGNLVYDLPSLEEIRKNTKDNLAGFHRGIKRFINPHLYLVGLEQNLYNLKTELIEKVRSHK